MYFLVYFVKAEPNECTWLKEHNYKEIQSPKIWSYPYHQARGEPKQLGSYLYQIVVDTGMLKKLCNY
jgi:hypothetical protein